MARTNGNKNGVAGANLASRAVKIHERGAFKPVHAVDKYVPNQYNMSDGCGTIDWSGLNWLRI